MSIKRPFQISKKLKPVRGKFLAIASEGSDFPRDMVDDLILIPDCHPAVQPILATIPLQLMAYAIALARGCDVDKPRNLAKSVTVE